MSEDWNVHNVVDFLPEGWQAVGLHINNSGVGWVFTDGSGERYPSCWLYSAGPIPHKEHQYWPWNVHAC